MIVISCSTTLASCSFFTGSWWASSSGRCACSGSTVLARNAHRLTRSFTTPRFSPRDIRLDKPPPTQMPLLPLCQGRRRGSSGIVQIESQRSECIASRNTGLHVIQLRSIEANYIAIQARCQAPPISVLVAQMARHVCILKLLEIHEQVTNFMILPAQPPVLPPMPFHFHVFDVVVSFFFTRLEKAPAPTSPLLRHATLLVFYMPFAFASKTETMVFVS